LSFCFRRAQTAALPKETFGPFSELNGVHRVEDVLALDADGDAHLAALVREAALHLAEFRLWLISTTLILISASSVQTSAMMPTRSGPTTVMIAFIAHSSGYGFSRRGRRENLHF
jgi:hypothetical protein